MFATYLLANYYNFRGLVILIFSNWPALSSLLKLTKTAGVALLRVPARWAEPRPIFYQGIDANGPERSIYIGGIHGPTEDALRLRPAGSASFPTG
jgi:hypothetical protein